MAVLPVEPFLTGVEVTIVTCGAVVCSDLRTQQPFPYYESKSMRETTQFIVMHFVSVPKKGLYQ
jgi:hypothetical protein